jgi:septal ring factor EnvC (AmiA/AmiB activator)
MRFTRVRRAICATVLSAMLVYGVASIGALRAQQQQMTQEQIGWSITQLSREMETSRQQIEALRVSFARLDNRQSVTETQLSTIIWILGVVAVAIITQLSLAISNVFRLRRNEVIK